MGIFSIINRSLLPKSKSKLKSLCPSNPWLGASFLSSPLPIPVAGFGKNQVRAPIFGDDVNKHMFLIKHEKRESTAGACYSLLSTKERSWKLENNKIPGHGIRSGDLYVGCNGLYLCVVYGRGDPMPAEHLWNPTTEEIKALPRSQPPRPSYKSHHSDTYGMGFDPKSKDYKVLRFLQFVDEDLPEDIDVYVDPVVEIYSLNTDSWRKIAYPLACCPPSQHNAICINAIYYGATYEEDNNVILSFDFANEEFSPALIPLPEKVRPTPGWEFFGFRLVEYDGALAVILHSELGSSKSVPPLSFEVRVWNGESWTPRVSTATFFVDDVPGGVEKVLGLFGNDKLFLQAYEGELFLFDCKTRVSENLGIHATPWLLDVFPHVECFVSLHPK